MSLSSRTSVFCPTPVRTISLADRDYVSLYSPERDDFDNFYVRYETFCFFPSWVAPRNTCYNMAKAGFYYTGDDLVVKCWACKSIITEFRTGDNPFGTAAHRSNCPFNIREMENGTASASSSAVRHSDNTGDDTNTTRSSLPTTTVIAADTPLGESRTGIDRAKLIKENERLRSEMTCKKCKQTSVDTLFLPCRHLVACEECAINMENCITCNAEIHATYRTYGM